MSNIKNKVENFKFKRSANNEKEINNLANLTKGSLYKLLSIQKKAKNDCSSFLAHAIK